MISLNHMEKYKSAKFIFVVGIGGSDLASKAVWNAITLHKTDVEKKVFFLEAPDVREYEEVRDLINNTIVVKEDLALITVSKSGSTEETLETHHKIFDILSEKFGPSIEDRVLVISTKDSPLWQLATEKNIEHIEWALGVGGRFSAFTVAHTSVLSIAGLNVSAFLLGSKETDTTAVSHLAEELFEHYKKGINILDFFIFNSELEDLGKWSRQLLAESLSSITPTVSIGPTDLHSMLELYLGGPKNRFTIFLCSMDEISGTVNKSAYEKVTAAYTEAELPFMKYEIEKMDEKNLGSFMEFLIQTTLELARLMEVDPYDQPKVEEYKSNIKNELDII